MIYLIEYERRLGRLVTFEEFKDSERIDASNKRLEIELALNRRGVQHEVVLLQAASKEALRRTHRRYFESSRQIVEAADSSV